MTTPHVLILGGGYVGLYTAWGLEPLVRRGELRITVVEPNPYMTYKPLLPEVAGGEIEPRNVTVPLRRALRRSSPVAGRLESLDCDSRTATLHRLDDTEVELHYDHVVLALGAVTRVIPTPGLEEQGIGFATLEEALHLRNHVLDRIRWAASTSDAEAREKALTFVFVGGGYTGVEAITELQDLAAHTLPCYPELSGFSPRWVLVEAADQIAVELGEKLGRWSQQHLHERGIEVLRTTMVSCENGDVVLDNGERMPADTIVWTAGVTPNPALDGTNLPRGPKGHVVANARMQVVRDDGSVVSGAWAAGDNAQIPDLTSQKQPAYYPPNAQNAVRQAKLLAKNIAGALRGAEPVEYRHESLGTLASYGPGQGAAVVKGIRLHGLPAWVFDRAYHGMAMPTLARKIRLFLGWAINSITPRDITSTSAIIHPRRPFQAAAEIARAAARKKEQQKAK
ncbi:NAD(P)/FAD-dependent oxidoreductase [Microbacterium elymi]|uniref:FAD-dependent oxidoreductase n=1 Tax=Microbacterium elymi TaxID=2909587 RepID=A0ABY5NIL4_9MICO|nr:FAD-dependent oxidoreductase [Microbacterium elymi]UUT35023.1 FAD-dependent oxidoreductase [Microbacterium elymi]